MAFARYQITDSQNDFIFIAVTQQLLPQINSGKAWSKPLAVASRMHDLDPLRRDPGLLNQTCRKVADGKHTVGLLQCDSYLISAHLCCVQYLIAMGIDDKRQPKPPA